MLGGEAGRSGRRWLRAISQKAHSFAPIFCDFLSRAKIIFPNRGIFWSREPWDENPRRWTNQRASFGGNGATRGSARRSARRRSSTTPRTARATSAPASHARCEHFGDARGGHSGISRRERARASRGVSQGGVSRRGIGRLRICVSHRSSTRGGVAPARVSVPRAPRTGRVRPGEAGRRRRLPRRARGRFHSGASHARAHAFGSSDASAANFNPLHIRPIPADLTDASRALPLPRSTYRVRSARSSTITPSTSTPY